MVDHRAVHSLPSDADVVGQPVCPLDMPSNIHPAMSSSLTQSANQTYKNKIQSQNTGAHPLGLDLPLGENSHPYEKLQIDIQTWKKES